MSEPENAQPSGGRPAAPKKTGDCALAGVSFIAALVPLGLTGLLFIMPRPWSIFALAAAAGLAAAGLVTGILALQQIAESDDTLRGRPMALAGIAMGALGIIAVMAVAILLARLGA